MAGVRSPYLFSKTYFNFLGSISVPFFKNIFILLSKSDLYTLLRFLSLSLRPSCGALESDRRTWLKKRLRKKEVEPVRLKNLRPSCKKSEAICVKQLVMYLNTWGNKLLLLLHVTKQMITVHHESSWSIQGTLCPKMECKLFFCWTYGEIRMWIKYN